MIHHIIKEKDIEEICPYCKNEVAGKDFKIELVEGVNYKTTKCKCGKNLMIRVNKEIYNYKDGEGNMLVHRIKFEDKKMHKKEGAHDK